jgi:hypothetical protein
MIDETSARWHPQPGQSCQLLFPKSWLAREIQPTISIGFSGLRKRFRSFGPSLPVSLYGASAFGRPADGRLEYPLARSWRLENFISSLMVIGSKCFLRDFLLDICTLLDRTATSCGGRRSPRQGTNCHRPSLVDRDHWDGPMPIRGTLAGMGSLFFAGERAGPVAYEIQVHSDPGGTRVSGYFVRKYPAGTEPFTDTILRLESGDLVRLEKIRPGASRVDFEINDQASIIRCEMALTT